MTSKTVLAPAKINLTLEVLARRKNGYHGLRSLVAPIGLYDRLNIDWHAAPFSFGCSIPELEANNIVTRAFAALETLGIAAPRARLQLEKRIPVGAGLGGGSSDAAAVLSEAMLGTFGPPPTIDWIETARSLGSDVPLFLTGTATLVEGTGERVTALGHPPPWWTVLVHPAVFVSSADAYAILDEQRPEPPAIARAQSRSVRAGEALQRGDIAALVEEQCNDFHDVMCARFPAIAAAVQALRAAGARRPILSGSGSTVASICAGEAEATAIAQRLPPDLRTRSYCVPLLCTGWRGALDG